MNEKSLKLLEQYELELLDTRRGRGSYICETSLGTKLFAEYNGSEKKIIFTNQVLDIIERGGVPYVDKVTENKEGTYLCRDWEEQTFVLKDWYEGKECDTRNNMQVCQAAANLAQLHKLMVRQGEVSNQNYVGEDLRTVWERHNRELKKIHEFIRRRKQKTAFENEFLKLYPLFAQQAKEALKKLSTSCYEKLLCDSVENGKLCHGNYNQHNIYFLGRGLIFTSNFEKCGYNIQINDLYQFLRKIMEKQGWNCQTGDQILEAYNREKSLTEAETEYLKIRLCYPEKFWKIANQYYNCRKSCASWKNSEKLEKLADYEESRSYFLRWMR